MNKFFITAFLLGLALCTANILPSENFNAKEDAKRLHHALADGKEELITDILAYRSGEQRVEIAQAYKAAYKKDLVEDFNSELSGDYEDLMVAMVTPLLEYYAKELFTDAQVYVPDSKAALDIVATGSNAELKAIDETYKRLKLNTEFDMTGILSVVFQGLSDRMIYGAFEGSRNETQEVDVEAAKADAKLIHDIGEGKSGYTKTFTDERNVENIFITRSYPQLRQIFKEYQTLYGHGIEKAFLDRGFDPDIARGALNMIPIIISKNNYFATRLYDTMHGAGTTDRVLIRILVSRSENDLSDIKTAFYKLYDCTLGSMIKDDTSGEYQRALLAIAR